VCGPESPGNSVFLPRGPCEEGAGSVCGGTGEKVIAGELCYLIAGGKVGGTQLRGLAVATLYLDRYPDDYI